MDKKTITQIATAALITTAGITVTNNIKSLNNITGSGSEVKAATTQSAQQFVNKAASAATNASSKYGTYTSVMIAQAAVESGYGNSTLSQEPNNNLFGIKGSYNGQSVAMKTGEYDSNGNYYTTTANFRKYPSYEESFNDNGALLRSQMGDYYSGAWVENASSGKEATQNGLQGKYATAPSYSQTLNSVIDAYDLQQYDPVTTNVNETKTVTNTTPIVDAPVDSDVGTQVGTAREGQEVNVTKYITYNNGVSHAYIGTGWVNNSAFATTQPTTTDTSASQTTQPTQTTQATQPATSQTAIVKQPAAQPAKPETTTQAQATKAAQTSAVKTTQAVKTTSTVKKTTVSQAPSATKTVEAVVKTTAPKTTSTTAKSVTKAAPQATTTKKSVQEVAKTTTSVATAKPATTTTQTKSVAKPASTTKKATVKKADTVKSVVKEAEVATPTVANTKKDDTKKSASVETTTTKTVKAEAEKSAPVETKTSTKSDVKTNAAKITTISVAPKAAVTAVVKTAEKATTPAKTVKSTKTVSKSTTTSSAAKKVVTKTVKSAKVVTTKVVQPVADKKTTAKVKSAVAAASKVNSKVEKLATKPIVETTTTKKVSAEASQIGNNDYVIKAKGVLTINARPDYGVAIWTVPGKKRTSRYLKNGTSWKFFKIAMVNGEKWYNLGGNQWVPAKAVMVR